MAKKPETIFKERCQRDLKKDKADGVKIWFIKTQMVALLGIPDFIGCTNGKFWALELKKEGKSETSRLQDHRLNQIRAVGGYAKTCSPTDWDEIRKEITNL